MMVSLLTARLTLFPIHHVFTQSRVVFFYLETSLLISAILARIVAVVALGALERDLVTGAGLGHDNISSCLRSLLGSVSL